MAPLSHLLLLLLVVAASIAATDAFATPSRTINPSVAQRTLLSHDGFSDDALPSAATARALISRRHHCSNARTPSSVLRASDSDEGVDKLSSSDAKFYTPLDRPLLAIVDTVSLVVFAAIGKSSHSADGSLDLIAVLVTAFPFVAAWLATSPITGVYSPDDRDGNMLASTAMKVGQGWILAVPLGIALRGAIKGYMPPLPFVIVTLVTTLVILSVVRVLFSFVEDFFVELVN